MAGVRQTQSSSNLPIRRALLSCALASSDARSLRTCVDGERMGCRVSTVSARSVSLRTVGPFSMCVFVVHFESSPRVGFCLQADETPTPSGLQQEPRFVPFGSCHVLAVRWSKGEVGMHSQHCACNVRYGSIWI